MFGIFPSPFSHGRTFSPKTPPLRPVWREWDDCFWWVRSWSKGMRWKLQANILMSMHMTSPASFEEVLKTVSSTYSKCCPVSCGYRRVGLSCSVICCHCQCLSWANLQIIQIDNYENKEDLLSNRTYILFAIDATPPPKSKLYCNNI